MTTRFKQLPQLEADAVVGRFVADRPAALAHLRERLAADAEAPGEVLDGSVTSLEPLWGWVQQQLRPGPAGGWATDVEQVDGQPVPGWYRHQTPHEPSLAPAAVRLLDGVIAYVGEVVQVAVPGAAWRRGHDPNPRYVNRNAPVVGSGDHEVGVVGMVVGLGRRVVRDDPTAPERLRELAQRWVKGLREFGARPADEAGTPPGEELAAVLEVAEGDEAGRWTVFLADDVRGLVGDDAIAALAATLPGDPMVDAAGFEDREVLHVRTSLSGEELHRRVVVELTRSGSGHHRG